MDQPASVSEWIKEVKADGQEAAQRLYERYLEQLADEARKKMNGSAQRTADAEDAAHAALTSFFHRARQGSFPQLAHRDDLWQVLVMLTDRRVTDLYRRQSCLKRGAGCELGESAIGGCGGEDSDCRAIEQVVGREPEPGTAVEWKDLCERLLDGLDRPLLKKIAALKLAGYDHAEIAEQLGYARRTVQRKLLLIREIWQQAGER